MLEETKQINKLFFQSNIDYVLLKGIALLVSGYYKDVGERMIGDIDILVKEEQLIEANDLLKSNGYDASLLTFGSKYFDNKHLPRLSSKVHLGAVEIHRRLLAKDRLEYLDSKDILDHKVFVNEFPIPQSLILFKHVILNQEINNYGKQFKSINLRSAYDTLLLINNHDNNFSLNITNSTSTNYFIKLSPFFEAFNLLDKSLLQKISLNLFLLKTKFTFLESVSFKYLYVKRLIILLVSRIKLFFLNKNYRKDVINDRKRLLNLLLSKKIR